MDSAEQYRKQYDFFITQTQAGRETMELCRNFFDGNQWSEEETETMRDRRQIPLVINRTKPKANGFVGLVRNRNTTIRAYPRTKQDESSANAISDALTYVSDLNEFQLSILPQIAENIYVEGVSAAIIAMEDADIKIDTITPDRFYYDPFSKKKDFSDAKFMGFTTWIDAGDLDEMFPNASELLVSSNSEIGDYYARDKPDHAIGSGSNWESGSAKAKRVMIAQHYHKDNGQWMECFFCGDTLLRSPSPSPYINEKGKPICPIVADCCYIDAKNVRYGEVLSLVDLNKELNVRRSKALHILNSNLTVSSQGAIQDVEKMKAELNKPNGHIELSNRDDIDRAFRVLPTHQDIGTHFEFYKDVKGELDAISVNAQLAGERQGDLSGKAIAKLQTAGALEVSHILDRVDVMQKGIFKQVFLRIKQFWTDEMWVRVTDDIDNLRWVGLNVPVTWQTKLQDLIDDKSQPQDKRQQAQQVLMQMQQAQDPRLTQVVMQNDMPMIKNHVPQLVMDIKLDSAPNYINIEQEQFELMASMNIFDAKTMIKASSLRNKKELLESLEEQQQAQMQAMAGQQQVEAQKVQIDNEKTAQEARFKSAQSTQIELETQAGLHALKQFPVYQGQGLTQ